MNKSLRINLQFGCRTEPELLSELQSLPPYRRAKFVQKLIAEAWCARRTPAFPMPASAPPTVRTMPTAPVLNAFEDELLSGVGSVLKF